DTSQWFERRRGAAVGIFASGNYLAGALWPPIVQHFIAGVGWRVTYVGIGVCCAVSMLALVGILRRSPPLDETAPAREWIGLGPPGRRPPALPAPERPRRALHGLGALRPRPGRHRALVRHDRAGELLARRSGRPRGRRDDGHRVRDGAGRLHVGGDLRSDGLL